jgi:glycosyltransferase involved in cell wall biosynthesis
MIIAFLTHEPFFPPSGGGSAEAVYLVGEMAFRGHEVHLFCPKLADANLVRTRFKVHLHEFTTWEMGRYTCLRTPKYLLYPTFLQRLVEEVGRTVKFDCLFSQHAISAVTAGRLKKKWGLPVVMNFLDYLTGFMETWPPYLAPPPALAMLKRFELNMPKKYQVDGVLTVSDRLADYFAESGYPRERIQPIYYGFDSALFPFRTLSPRTSSDRPVIVMHGSLDHHHLKEIGLAALKVVHSELPQARLKLVGHRTDAVRNFVHQAARKIPGVNIEITGFVPYDKVSEHLQSADVGIVPYEQSTGTHCAFVAKIVEYLAVGLPVVSTRLNSAFRYFKDEPMLKFTDFDGAAFGRTIVESLRNPLPNISEAAREASDRVRRELDWRTISRRAVDFMETRIRGAGTA